VAAAPIQNLPVGPSVPAHVVTASIRSVIISRVFKESSSLFASRLNFDAYIFYFGLPRSARFWRLIAISDLKRFVIRWEGIVGEGLGLGYRVFGNSWCAVRRLLFPLSCQQPEVPEPAVGPAQPKSRMDIFREKVWPYHCSGFVRPCQL
jgi:hypothetical protein